jgi:hypothetical protein
VLIRVCFMILASEGMPELKRKETKAKEGKMAEQDATTKVFPVCTYIFSLTL